MLVAFVGTVVCLLQNSGILAPAPADLPGPAAVRLVVQPWNDQAVGWPVIVDVTVTNISDVDVTWWSAGPGNYIGAEHFEAKVRYDPTEPWIPATATNGQFQHGSGIWKKLKPGESITNPLAIPVEPDKHALIEIRTRSWKAESPVTSIISISDRAETIDRRRAEVISAVMSDEEPFLRHLAQKYDDPVVTDAMLKMMTVDNMVLCNRAAYVIVFKNPATTPALDEALAAALDRWLNRAQEDSRQQMSSWLISASLRTQSEPVRDVVLNHVRTMGNGRVRVQLLEHLGGAPGDEAWLLRVLATLQELHDADGTVPPDVERAETRMNGRLDYPQNNADCNRAPNQQLR